MSYELHFHPDALDEWGKLEKTIRGQLKKKLAERLQEPHVPGVETLGSAKPLQDQAQVRWIPLGLRSAG
jgi:mRNA interferase RelE/StbE